MSSARWPSPWSVLTLTTAVPFFLLVLACVAVAPTPSAGAFPAPVVQPSQEDPR